VHRHGRCPRPSSAGLFHIIGGAELAKINIPVAVLIWLMFIPMLLKLDFAALGER